jgi:adenylate cyclase
VTATRGTAIAALEAARNEEQVLAEGALVGERRVALVRLVMIAMFAAANNVTHASTPAMVATGVVYTIFAVITLWRVRGAKSDPYRARRIPLVIATIDFAFATTQGLLDATHNEHFSAGQAAIATAILMSFAIARWPFHHVVYSAVLGVASFAIVTFAAGELVSASSAFVLGGLIVLAVMVALTNLAVRSMFSALRKRDNLTRFLPQQVAERVIEHGPSALAPVEREVTVLFSDIRGFTSMSEGMGPSEVLSMLDDYFGRMSQIVKGHDGVVGKFLGDGLLAFWGVPDRMEDHAIEAVRAARDMRKVLAELNEHREREGKKPLRIGIGIHTGNVAAGMLGGALQAEYTIIGDAVNVASRVEGLTKDHKVDLLVSETTFMRLREPPPAKRLDPVEIRGRKEPIVLYAVE